MRLSFEIVVEGEETLREKFLSTIQNNPQIQNELVNYFGQGIMWGFHLKEDDKIFIKSFKAKEIKEEETKKEEKND